ncbi:MAG: TonB family protein [Vicinamibacterales bacterium]
MTRYLAGVVVALGILCTLVPAPAAGQVPQTESELLAAASQSPQQVSNYLDLAKLYVDQGRLDEAELMLGRAVAIIRQQRLATAVSAAATGQAPLRVGGDIKEPRKIRDVKPVYPQEALAAGVQGVVILEAVIGPAGNVTDARVLRSVALLDQAALDAVRQWEFTPTLLNGAPVSVIMTMTVNFTLR